MKIFILSVTTLFIIKSAIGQVEFGIIAGPQIMTARYEIAETKQETEFKYGFQVGGTLKVPFDNNLYFVPAIFYSTKGYKTVFTKPSFPPDPTATDNDVIFHNIEIAPLLQIDFSKQPGHLFARFGPSIETQLFGKETYNTITGEKISRNTKFSFSSYGRFTANIITALGYETPNGITLMTHFTLGIANISNKDGGPSILHRAFGLTLGKFFGRNKIIMNTRNKE